MGALKRPRAMVDFGGGKSAALRGGEEAIALGEPMFKGTGAGRLRRFDRFVFADESGARDIALDPRGFEVHTLADPANLHPCLPVGKVKPATGNAVHHGDGGVERQKEDAGPPEMADVGSDIQLLEPRYTGKRGHRPQADSAHPEWDNGDPRLTPQRVDLQRFGNMGPQEGGIDRPVEEGKIVPRL